MCIRDRFDTLYEEGASSGRVMALALHPYLMGMPHRIEGLEEILEYLLGHDLVWQATASEIADHFMEHHYEEFVQHSKTINTVQNAR